MGVVFFRAVIESEEPFGCSFTLPLERPTLILRGRWKAGPKIGLWNFLDVSLILFASLTIRTNPGFNNQRRDGFNNQRDGFNNHIFSNPKKTNSTYHIVIFNQKAKWLSTGWLYSTIELLGRRLAPGPEEEIQRTQNAAFFPKGIKLIPIGP